MSVGSICAIFGCLNYKQQKESKSFFRMPKEKERLEKWITACQRKDLDELFKIRESDYFYKSYVVCSDHFEIQCFRNKNLFSQGLLPGSVPTLNLRSVPIEPKREIIIIEETFLQDSCNEKRNVSNSTNVVIDATPIKEIPNELSTSEVLMIMLRDENSNLKLSIKQYQKKINNKSCLLWKYKKQNKALKQKLVQSQKRPVLNFDGVNKVCEQFIRTQIRLMNKPKLGRRYGGSDKEFALALYNSSKESYALCQKFFCLPSISLLRSWLNKTELKEISSN